MSLTDTPAEQLRAGADPVTVLEDLRELADTALARAQIGDVLQFRLVHGDIESSAQSNLLNLLRATAGHTVLVTRGGNDWTDYLLHPDAQATLTAMDGVARAYAPPWWHWTTDGTDPMRAVRARGAI